MWPTSTVSSRIESCRIVYRRRSCLLWPALPALLATCAWLSASVQPALLLVLGGYAFSAEPALQRLAATIDDYLSGGAWLDGGGQSIAYLRPARCGVERAQPIARDGAPRSLALSLARARARTCLLYTSPSPRD